MPMISLDPEQARSTASTFDTNRSSIESDLSSMQASVNQLLGTWQGQSRLEFEQEWGQWSQRLRDMVNRLQGLANGLRREADEIESIDRSFQLG
ncbi:WXG100 family type VII secretion target [Chloroflexus sp.]|uniref:WXG100 family type VII secretion target n=1 Tax=Chloroflexus sp. TaxID=1904827 RepID=UPI00404B3364